jgi:hypothetical protein
MPRRTHRGAGSPDFMATNVRVRNDLDPLGALGDLGEFWLARPCGREGGWVGVRVCVRVAVTLPCPDQACLT